MLVGIVCLGLTEALQAHREVKQAAIPILAEMLSSPSRRPSELVPLTKALCSHPNLQSIINNPSSGAMAQALCDALVILLQPPAQFDTAARLFESPACHLTVPWTPSNGMLKEQ